MLGAAALAAAPALSHAKADTSLRPLHLAAAWDTPQGARVGIVAIDGSARLTARIVASLDVPTRAHAVACAPDGSVLVVARRPGDWMVRLRPAPRGEHVHAQRWQWIEPDRAFDGHVIATPDGTRVLTTETDLASGMGLVGVRDAATLEKLDEWPTHGRDPHELLWLASTGRARLAIANGGISTLAETGRAKHDLAAMDPSLVVLDGRSGTCEGQWRLPDARLSTRHLAQRDGVLAIALQAEHDDPHTRAQSPVLALFDGRVLSAVPSPRQLAGYGGGVAATTDGFVVSCPRANGVAHFDARGAWLGFIALADACPLAVIGEDLYIGGGTAVLRRDGAASAQAHLGRPVTLDNHWAALRTT